MTTQPRETATILASLGDREDLTYAQTILWAAVIGVTGGLVATAYYDVMEACLHWSGIPSQPNCSLSVLATFRIGTMFGLSQPWVDLCRVDSKASGTTRRSRDGSRQGP